MASADPMPPAGASASDVPLAGGPAAGVGISSSYFQLLFVRLRQSLADGSLFFGIATVAVWMLSRPFEGIEGDAQIYMARALADLDPAGVGHDMMFVHDGQSQFSIFPFFAEKLVAGLNPANTSFVFAGLNLICWFAAALFFIGRFTQARMKWAILMIVAAVPSFYGPFHLLRFGEQFATPRPLTEACVLTALAFLIDRRRGYAFGFLVVAAALHPIMALPGLLIFGIDLCRDDRRWIALGLGLLLIGAIAALCGLPLFDRLMTPVDADWLALLRLRNAYLFPTLWPYETLAFVALQIATVLVAADLLCARVRWIFYAAAGLGVSGVILGTLLGDLWPLLLVVQAQLWRMTWLTGVVAAISLALCLLRLPGREPRGELACAFLTLAWLKWDEPLFALSAAAAALLLHYLRGLNFPVSRTILNLIWGAVVLIGIMDRLRPAMAFVRYRMESPLDFHPAFLPFWNVYLLSIPIVAFAVLWALRPGLVSPKIAGAVAAVALLGTIGLWDDRDQRRKLLDSDQYQPALAALLPADRSEIYWLGGVTESWHYVKRPGWALNIQGAGIVFSRPLAMVWQARIDSLFALGLADESLLDARTVPAHDASVQMTRASIDQLCAREDGPEAIVAPLEEGTPDPTGFKFKTWRPPVPQFRLTQDGDAVTWHRLAKFIIVSCADHAQKKFASGY